MSGVRLDSATGHDLTERARKSPGMAACLAIYLMVVVPVSLLGVWSLDLVGMEGIIALGARHMLDTGEWFVPHLYGEIYAFKPALAYWLAAIPEYLFGHSTEFTLRLPTALCGMTLGAMLCLAMGRLVTPLCGLWCALTVALSGLFIEQVRSATFDIPLALGTGVAILTACRNLARGRSEWYWWMVGYLGLAFGFFAKGLPAIAIYGLGLLVASLVLGRVKDLIRWQHLLGVSIFVLLVGIYVDRCYQAEGRAAFSDHLSELTMRSGQWSLGSIALVLLTPLLALVMFLPFSSLLIIAPFHRPRAPLSDLARRLHRAAWAFFAVGIAVFMISSTRDSRYYLPLITPVAMLCGLAAETVTAVPRQNPIAGHPHGLSIWAVRRAELGRRLPIILAVVGVCYWAVYAGIVQPRRSAKGSERVVAEAIAPHVPESATVYVAERDSQSSLAYYLNRPVRAWQPDEPPPASFFYLIVLTSEPSAVSLGSDLVFEPIAGASGPRRGTYLLGIARQVEPDTPSKG